MPDEHEPRIRESLLPIDDNVGEIYRRDRRHLPGTPSFPITQALLHNAALFSQHLPTACSENSYAEFVMFARTHLYHTTSRRIRGWHLMMPP